MSLVFTMMQLNVGSNNTCMRNNTDAVHASHPSDHTFNLDTPHSQSKHWDQLQLPQAAWWMSSQTKASTHHNWTKPTVVSYHSGYRGTAPIQFHLSKRNTHLLHPSFSCRGRNVWVHEHPSALIRHCCPITQQCVQFWGLFSSMLNDISSKLQTHK